MTQVAERPAVTTLSARGSAADAGGSAWAGWVFTGLAALTPLFALFGNLGFAPLTALAGILLLPFVATRAAPWRVLGLLALGLAFALASLAWSPFHPPPLTSLKAAGQATGLKLALQLGLYGAVVVGAARVSPAGASRTTLVAGLGLAVLAAVLVAEAVDGAAAYQALRRAFGHASPRPDWAVRDVARGVYVVVLLVWPLALALARRAMTAAAVVMVAGAVVGALALHVDAPLVALVASIPVVLAVRAFGRPAVVATAAAAVLYLAFAPLAVAVVAPLVSGHALSEGIGKGSWAVRLDVWRFVEALVAQKPLLGWGLDASRAWPGQIPLHPHDAALQLWLELGAPGAAAAALVWTLVFAGIVRQTARDRALGAAAAGAAVAYLVIGALSFGVWQEWWLALGAIAAATVTLVERASPTAPPVIAEGGLRALGASSPGSQRGA